MPLIEGTKSGLKVPNAVRGGSGIKPVESAAKALYALQSCYEGSPSRPRGAIVGGRRFAYDRAEQADPSGRPRSPARGGWYRRTRPCVRNPAISLRAQSGAARGGGNA